MVFEAQREHQLDLARSFFVGDKASDIECGRNAGVRTISSKPAYGAHEADSSWPIAIARDLSAKPTRDHPRACCHEIKALGVIPARWGSTRFPGKPLHLDRGQSRCSSTSGNGAGARRNWTRDHRHRRLAHRGSGFCLGRGSCADLRRIIRSGTDRIAEVAAKMQRRSVTSSTFKAMSR